MSEIFISYASADRQIARQFAEALESAGWSVWWDREIPVGESFDQVIEEELNAARCVVVLWSKHSVQSRWVKAESAAAADRERLVPALIDEVPIPLEFRRIQTATLVEWDGDTANPEFQRLVEAVRSMVAQAEPSGTAGAQKTDGARKLVTRTRLSPRLLGVGAVVLLMIVGLMLTRSTRSHQQDNTPHPSDAPAESVRPSSPAHLSGPVSPSQSPAPSAASKPAAPEGAIPIKIGAEIGDGAPAPGAGAIETPHAEDVYSFAAVPGQRAYFRMRESSQGMSQIEWRLLDGNGMEVFVRCLGCGDPGVQTLSRGGYYTLTVGSKTDPSTGTYRLQLYDVPAPDRFPIKVGDAVKEDSPGSGAGAIESPGAEDIYTFTATPRQHVYFRMLESSQGMSQIEWRLLDGNGMEVFDRCLGCGDPGVQALTHGGSYTLTVSSQRDPSTGTYRLQLYDVPAADRFPIKVGDVVKVNVPGPGAGVIESPGVEDIYTFAAAPRQQVYFRMLESSHGMSQIEWRLLDDNGMEVFTRCLGCGDPGVQALTKGGDYTLIVGTRTNPATGNYAFETGAR